MVLQAELISKGYHYLVPGLISIFRDGIGPFNCQKSVRAIMGFPDQISAPHKSLYKGLCQRMRGPSSTNTLYYGFVDSRISSNVV